PPHRRRHRRDPVRRCGGGRAAASRARAALRQPRRLPGRPAINSRSPLAGAGTCGYMGRHDSPGERFYVASIDIPLGLTFDDVLLRPAESDILPSMADTSTRLTRDIALNIPVLSAAMDTVTEADMAIVMAQLGRIGVLHRNLTIEQQCTAARAVK